MIRYTSKYKEHALVVFDAFSTRGDVTIRKLKGATPADGTWLVRIERATLDEVKTCAADFGLCGCTTQSNGEEY